MRTYPEDLNMMSRTIDHRVRRIADDWYAIWFLDSNSQLVTDPFVTLPRY